jgi:hypothetical protein
MFWGSFLHLIITELGALFPLFRRSNTSTSVSTTSATSTFSTASTTSTTGTTSTTSTTRTTSIPSTTHNGGIASMIPMQDPKQPACLKSAIDINADKLPGSRQVHPEVARSSQERRKSDDLVWEK